jgi:hypothetical protein
VKIPVAQNTTSKKVRIRLGNSSVSTGAGLTGVVYNTSGLTGYYYRDGDASTTSISLVTATLGTFTSGGWILVDATNMPGVYEVGIPNAVFATLGTSIVCYRGAVNMVDVLLEFDVTAVNDQSANNFMTGINAQTYPSAVPGASGGLFISGNNSGTTTFGALTVTGATNLTGNVSLGGTLGVTGAATLAAGLNVTQSTANGSAVVFTGNGTGHGLISTSGGGATGDGAKFAAASTNGNGVTMAHAGTGSDFNATTTPLVLAKTTNITGLNDIAATAIVSAGAITTSSGAVSTVTTTTTATNLTNAPTAGDFTAAMKTSLNAATPASVTGAVGSVTGNVGGNVTGSVGSVTAAVSLTTAETKIIQSGTAGAGASTTITIATALGTTADIVGCKIKITGGTGANQTRVITGYVNGTKIVTVDYAWVTTPDNTSTYAIWYDNAPILNSSLYVTAIGSGTFNANVTAINSISTSSVTTVNANIGTTQAIVFDGNNYQKVDVVDIAGTASAGAAGYVGIDWAHVTNNDTVLDLGGTTVFNAQVNGITMLMDTLTGALGVDVYYWNDHAVPAPNVNGVPIVDLKYTLGTISPAAPGSVSADWAHVVNPTSTVGLTGTTIATSQVVASVTGAVGSVTGNVGGISGTTQTFDALQTSLNSAHGAGSWATATGFSTLTQAQVSGYAGPILTDNSTGLVSANVTKWSGGTVPTPNVIGVPITDLKYTLGTISPAVAGSVSVDWAHVVNPTAAVTLTNTTISASSSPTAAQVATAVWQDTTAGDFTAAGSIGKSLSPATLGTAPGASGGLLISGSNVGTTTFGAVTVTGALTLSGNVPVAGTVTLSALTVTNQFRVSGGAILSSSSDGGSGLVISGNTTGPGLVVSGGNAAVGATFTNGTGLASTADISLIGSGILSGTISGIAGTTQTFDDLETALNSTHGNGSWATANVEGGMTAQGFTTTLATNIGTTNTAVINGTYGLSAIHNYLTTNLGGLGVNATSLAALIVNGGPITTNAGMVDANTIQVSGQSQTAADLGALALANPVQLGQIGNLLQTEMGVAIGASSIPAGTVFTWVGVFGSYPYYGASLGANSAYLYNTGGTGFWNIALISPLETPTPTDYFSSIGMLENDIPSSEWRANGAASGTPGFSTSTDLDPWATDLPGSYPAGSAGYILGGNVELAATQDFNNTGQTTPQPAYGVGGSLINVPDDAPSPTYTNATLEATLNYQFAYAWSYNNLDLSSYSQIVFTIKANYTDADTAAIIAVKLTNPTAGGDGLFVLNGAAIAGPVTSADGALTVTVTPATSVSPAVTVITLALTARGMGIIQTAPARYLWELTWYASDVKQPYFDGGLFNVDMSVRTNPVQS